MVANFKLKKSLQQEKLKEKYLPKNARLLILVGIKSFPFKKTKSTQNDIINY